jgi:hypothetical protein
MIVGGTLVLVLCSSNNQVVQSRTKQQVMRNLMQKGGFMKGKVIIDDGFNPELVETAFFDGILEMPCIEKPAEIVIPDGMIPFSQRKKSKGHSEFLVFYEPDIAFGDFLRKPDEYLEEARKFAGVVTLDCSLYRDMPLQAQMANVYRSRAIGHYLQKHGIYVVPNIRWGDERSYTTCKLPECFAFLGIAKHSIVSVGTYGCIRGSENTSQFKQGLASMLDVLEPKVVLVYGAMPDTIFADFQTKTRFVPYPNWISLKRRGD